MFSKISLSAFSKKFKIGSIGIAIKILRSLLGGTQTKQKFKKFDDQKLSKRGLRRCTKFGQAHSNDEPKITLSLILHFIKDFRISYVNMGDAIKKENKDLNEKSTPLKKFCSIISIIVQKIGPIG